MQYRRYIQIYLFFLFTTILKMHASPYVVGNLMGQLGNQMFIIAAATSLAEEHGAVAVFPDLVSAKNKEGRHHNYEFLFSHLNIHTTKPDIRKIRHYYKEPHFHYAPIKYKHNMAIQGYFQSEKYFCKNKQKIIALFSPPEHIKTYLQGKYASLLEHPDTVAIHYRSYLQEDPHQTTHPTLNRDYFKHAVKLFNENALFVVFSNKMKECKNKLSNLAKNMIFIEDNDYIHDLYLMSMCKHNIISNSSFSWWAAYLNQNPEKVVVAPKLWFQKGSRLNTKDLIPKEWLIIPN